MSWIRTNSGKIFDYANTTMESIDINDIAHSLSMNCRFNSQINRFYSVAEHCIIMSRLASPENALWALLHDGTEAYVGDLPSPLKRLLPDYCEIEDNIMRVMCDKWDLPYDMPREVKRLDQMMLVAEIEEFFGKGASKRLFNIHDEEILDVRFEFMDFDTAKREYLNQFNILTRGSL
jgi:hypothetical protein